jgi:DNA-binding XRE family transcriptional regulator
MHPRSPAAVLTANLDRLGRHRKAEATLRTSADPPLRRLLDALVEQRIREGLTQQQVASRLRTTTSAISRLENGKLSRPTLTTIENYALVVGCRLTITVRPRHRYCDPYGDWV